MPSAVLRAPSAQTFTIADLVEHVLEGKVRIPGFQRSYRWEPDDVLSLFDSVYRGYPIGSLLLWKNQAPYEVIRVGGLEIQADATEEALWVVDGQQRITSLAGVLLSTGEIEDPRFSLFFDLEQERFVRRRRPTPRHFLPLNRVVDTRSLLRWLRELQDSGAADHLVSRAEDLAKRLREYQIPAYIVETTDETILRTIFDRLNTYGKSLKAAEVFQALHGGRLGHKPEDLRTLQAEVERLGFGSFDDNSLLRAVLGLRGPDVYRDFRSEFHGDEDPTDTFRDAAEAIERMVAFLRGRAAIPHVRVLPYRYVIPVLVRFFYLHPNPRPRSLTLMKRWIWRDALTPERRASNVSALRNAVRAIDETEADSVRRLLETTPSTTTKLGFLTSRLNEAKARAFVAIMSSWGPRNLTDGNPIDLADHFDQARAPLHQITFDGDSGGSLVDRMIHPPTVSSLASLIGDSPLKKLDSLAFREALETHAISNDAAEALSKGDTQTFLALRATSLTDRVQATAGLLAEWDTSDRPSLERLLVPEVDDE